MNYTDNKNREALEIKYKKMMERITMLEGLVELIYPLDEDKRQAMQIIKTYYQEMYNKILETGQYDKYEQVEDTILESMAKIEVEIEQYKQDTYKSIGAIVQNRLNEITDFDQDNTQESMDSPNVLEQLDEYISNNTTNLEKLLEQINQIKEMLKLYEEYIKPEKMEQIQEQISIAKFKILIRMQIGRVLVGEIRPQSTLCEYDSEEERKIFEQQLAELKKQTPNIQLEQPVSQIMQDSKILNRILEGQIMKMALKNIDLLCAPIFNAHLCSVDLSAIKHLDAYDKSELEKSIDAKISILSAVIDNLITKEDINIMYCGLIYKTFGFTCRPIILNEKQRAVVNLWQLLKEKGEKLPLIEPNYITLLTGGKKRIPIKPRKFDFSDKDEQYKYMEDDELVKKLIATETDGKIPETVEEEENEIEEIKRTYELYKESFIITPKKAEKRIEELKRKLEIIKKLRQTKQKDEQEAVEEIKERLEARYDALKFIGEKRNKWRMLPLSSVLKESATPRVPIEEGRYNMRNSQASFGSYYEYRDVPVIIYDISELWGNYIQSSNGIIKKPQYAKDTYMEEGLRFRFVDRNNSLPSYFYLAAEIELSKIAGLSLNDKIMDEIMKLDVDGR